MPANLARKADGTGAMFSVGATPWHREGLFLTRPPQNINDALSAAGLDFEVELRSVVAEHRREELPAFRATCRSDNGAVLGIVKRRYVPLQNRDAFQVLKPLLDSGKASLETAGALGLGEDIWVLVRFAVNDPVVKEVFADEVVPFGLLSNNHAGKGGVILQETPIRVVCANTLSMARRTAREGRAIRVRHTLGVERRTVDAAQTLWAALVERYRGIAKDYATLRHHFLTEDLFRRLVLDKVAPVRGEWERAEATPKQREALHRARLRRERIRALWSEGDGHPDRGSAWEAYNALVQSLDHDVALWPTRGDRTASLKDGRLEKTKQVVLDGLLRHAGVTR